MYIIDISLLLKVRTPYFGIINNRDQHQNSNLKFSMIKIQICNGYTGTVVFENDFQKSDQSPFHEYLIYK